MTAGALRIGLALGLAWDEPGGVQRVTRALAREFQRHGHRLALLALGQPGAHASKSLQQGARLQLLSPSRAPQSWSTFQRPGQFEQEVVRWCVEEELDVVHLQHLASLGLGLPGRLRELGRAVFTSLHDDSLVCPRGQMWSVDGLACESIEPSTCAACWQRTWPQCGGALAAREALEKRLLLAREALEACERVFVPSRSARQIALGWGAPAAKLELCPNGVEAPGALPARRPFDPSEVRIAVLGAVQPSKGVLFLARLVARLAAPFQLELHGPCHSYHGDRRHLDELNSLAAQTGRVHLRGAYAPDQLPRILSEVDLVCVPSLWHEVHGLAAREALLAGLPVFVAARGGLGELSTLQLPAGDDEAWGRALQCFAEDSPWRLEQTATAPEVRSVEEAALQHLRAYQGGV